MEEQVMKLIQDPKAERVFENYPGFIKGKMNALRKLIIDTASKTEEVEELIETLRWGEPSYLTRTGATIRIDWKEKNPDQYAIYFNCNSKLVPSIKAVYGNLFAYEGNRAIIFSKSEKLPKSELKSVIKAALRYHRVKHHPMLGL